MRRSPPHHRVELQRRANVLAGQSLAAIARTVGQPVPTSLRRDKGWVGTLMETALGASSGSLAAPDFPRLGVELKTIPMSPKGVPKESTYVCTAPLDGPLSLRWQGSWVQRKLSCVLWMPIYGNGPLGERRCGQPLLWCPNATQEDALRTDFESHMECIALGEYWQLSGKKGQVLQLRPKAANSAERVWALDACAEWVRVTPRGFYLRARFTRTLFNR